MQTPNRLLDDLARVANGAVSTLTGVREEVEALVKQRLERFLADADLVPRDEFDAIKGVARKAREEQEKLEARLTALEAELAALKAQARKPAPKKAAAAKPRTKAATASRTRASTKKT